MYAVCKIEYAERKAYTYLIERQLELEKEINLSKLKESWANELAEWRNGESRSMRDSPSQ